MQSATTQQYTDIQSIDWTGLRALVRVDLNVPMSVAGVCLDDTRLKAALPTVRTILDAGGSVTLIAHRGRPVPGESSAQLSLKPLLQPVSDALKCPVEWVPDWPAVLPTFSNTHVALAENCRFLKGEVENDPVLSQQMASGGDVFVMDAFGCAHRIHASTWGLAAQMPVVCLGVLMVQECQAIERVRSGNDRPTVLVVGGAKIESKLPMIEALLPQIDHVLVGGGVANTLLKASGAEVGQSLVDAQYLVAAEALLKAASSQNVTICLPEDATMRSGSVKPIEQCESADAIFDLGPQTQACYRNHILAARTVIWSGPMGVYEQADFASGSKAVACAMVEATGFTVLGGGDTVACLNQLMPEGLNQIDWISTGGGAFLAALAGHLPISTDLK
jgi:phosphoglycerate kinase